MEMKRRWECPRCGELNTPVLRVCFNCEYRKQDTDYSAFRDPDPEASESSVKYRLERKSFSELWVQNTEPTSKATVKAMVIGSTIGIVLVIGFSILTYYF